MQKVPKVWDHITPKNAGATSDNASAKEDGQSEPQKLNIEF